jgi:multidrug efflux pump subunit AcrA (membrane-fusion protein)
MQQVVCCVIASLVLVVGCAQTETPPQRQVSVVQSLAEHPAVTGVKVSPASLTTLAETIEAVGTVRSTQQSVVSSRLVARVVAVHVRAGERVKAGQVLVELDDADVQAQLHKAQAGRREAQYGPEEVERAIQAAARAVEAAQAQEDVAAATFRRYQVLRERRAVAPQEYDEITAKYKAATATVARAREEQAALRAKQHQVVERLAQAKAEVAQAQALLDYTRLRASIPGTVVAKPVEVGNLVSPGVSLCTIEAERYRFEATVQESDIQKIHTGQQATVSLDALGTDLTASVVEMVPAADPLSRTFTVKLDLPAAPGLSSGLYGKARFSVGQRQALLLPQQALVERGQLQGVFVVEPDHIARLRLVKTGKSVGDQVEILSGLHVGERTIVEGLERISDGSRVEEGAPLSWRPSAEAVAGEAR